MFDPSFFDKKFRTKSQTKLPKIRTRKSTDIERTDMDFIETCDSQRTPVHKDADSTEDERKDGTEYAPHTHEIDDAIISRSSSDGASYLLSANDDNGSNGASTAAEMEVKTEMSSLSHTSHTPRENHNNSQEEVLETMRDILQERHEAHGEQLPPGRGRAPPNDQVVPQQQQHTTQGASVVTTGHARDRRHLSGQSGSTVGTKKRNLSGDRAAVFVRERPLLGGRTHFRTGPAEKDRPEAAGAAARVATDPHVTPRTRQKVTRTTTG